MKACSENWKSIRIFSTIKKVANFLIVENGVSQLNEKWLSMHEFCFAKFVGKPQGLRIVETPKVLVLPCVKNCKRGENDFE